MNTKIYLAKYVPDPARWEPRNIGVIVDDGATRAARFLAEDSDGRIDGHRARYSVGAPVDVYREWVRHWRATMVRDGESPDHACDDRLMTFFVDEAGEIMYEADQRPIKELVAEYFARLVYAEPQAEVELRDAVEALITSSSVDQRPGFERNVIVEANKGKGNEIEEEFRFPYGYRNGHLIVGHRVPLQMDAFVHDALYRFQRLPKGTEAVAFVQGFERELDRPAVRNLEVYSRVVDVTEADAPEALERAFELVS